MKMDELSCIVAKVEAVGPKGYVTDLALLENRFQFKRHVEGLLSEIPKR
jgi:sulfopyruvate decarboxylase subunit beta